MIWSDGAIGVWQLCCPAGSAVSVDEISAGSISLGGIEPSERERRDDEREASLGFEREERGLGRREIRPGASELWDLAELSARGRRGRSREISIEPSEACREEEREGGLGLGRGERGLGTGRGKWGRSREIETVLALPLPLGEGGSSSPVRRPELGCPACPCPGTGCTGRLELDSFLDAGREESVEERRDAFFDELGLRPTEKFKTLPIPKLDGRCSAMLEGRAREDPLGLWKGSSVRVII